MKRMNRRTMLLGSLGTVMSLPLLEMGLSDGAFANAATEHTRFINFYLPNGVIQEQWWPGGGSGTNFTLEGTALAPLEPHKGALKIYKNFRNAGATSGGGNAHMRAIASFLTGTPIPNDRITRHVPSFDQALAEHYAEVAPTPIHSLQLAGNNKIDPPNSGTSYNNALKNALAFDKDGRIMTTTADLRATFDKLFAGVDSGESQREAEQRVFLRRSVLDYVKGERAQLSTQLGAGDRGRVEQYFDSIRELEKRLEAFEQQENQCIVEASNRPKAYRDDVDNHFIGEHARLTAELLALAFQCDITRVATYMSSGEASKTRYPEIDIDIKFHDQISHNKGAYSGQHHAIDTYHADLFAHFLTVFESKPHGEGTLLDGTCLLLGSGLGNGDAHSMNNIAVLTAGRFGGVRTGTYQADMNGAPHSRLLNSIRDAIGLPEAKFSGRPGGTLDLT